MQQLTLFISILSLFIPIFVSAGDGAFHVRGKLLCNGKPYENAEIELYEKNIIGKDTHLVTTNTTSLGFFSMKAAVSEWIGFSPNPYIHFANFCDPSNTIRSMQCAKTIKIFIPQEFVSDGHIPKMIFNIGDVELTKIETEKYGLEKFVYSIFSQKQCRDI
ncbi:TransThyretin-Related family domain [Caenorhabditis elegans]|uniref:TransThyretin-Related family domain n=1 Tax=Caenorhabditis elegans TaxID=6239 RepID=O17635_CAEEL|nr:TransThyretin-Related family domain [Caenorhabditis elegans]CAA92798.3 TransThyretin-Related family domain [Caenorhabditis elegans]|eukprot:NP_501683.3 TransThyretin-Related family domain [Caenorhabditis elegans]